MKKTLVIFAVSSFVLFFVSCKKETGKPNRSNVGTSSLSHTTRNSSLTPGQVHNAVLTLYYNTHSFDADGIITTNELSTILTDQATIAVNNDYMDASTDIDNLVAMTMEWLRSHGFFRNGVLVSRSDLSVLAQNFIANAAMKQAVDNLDALAAQGDDAHFLVAANGIIDNVKNLTTAEQADWDAFKSILNESYSFWTGMGQNNPQIMTSKVVIAIADAKGYLLGGQLAIETGQLNRYFELCEFMSRAYSTMAGDGYY